MSANNQNLTNDVAQMAEQAIQNGIFPCIEIFFAKGETLILHEVFGRIDKNPGSSHLEKNSLFDLASLTKPLATASAVLHLQETGEIDLTEKLSSFIPEFKKDETKKITIKHLLTHTSGLPDWQPLYEPRFNKTNGWERLIEVEPQSKLGSEMVYSCLGFILLAELIRKLSGVSLDEYSRRHIFGPIGLKNLLFNPELSRKDIVPTAFCPFRNKVLRGVVHDENAFIFDGEGGNSGLFGTAEDIYQYCLMLMNGGEINGNRVFRSETVQAFLENQNPKNISPRTMGWDYKLGDDEYMSCGKLMPVGSVGHLGFTGTSVWMDPISKYIIILLSNRVNITREANMPKMREFRPSIHDLLLSAVM